MWDCLLVFLQGGHSNYWRQTRRTIYCFPRCHWTTLPFIRALRFEDSTPLSANLLGPGLKCTSEQKREQNETIGRAPVIYATYI